MASIRSKTAWTDPFLQVMVQKYLTYPEENTLEIHKIVTRSVAHTQRFDREAKVLVMLSSKALKKMAKRF